MNKAYEEITNKIIDQLKQGCIPWEQPWFGSRCAISFATGKAYSFLNQLILGGESAEFLTWHQIQMLKGRLHKGSKGRRVFFWHTFEKAETDEKGEVIIKKVPYLRTYTVFRVADCDGIQPRWQPKASNNTIVSPIKQVEENINQYLTREHIELKHNSNDAYYSKKYDYINIAPIVNFKSTEDYYSTLLHEVCHSTGAKYRLGRFGENNSPITFGSKEYSREELIAELGSAFLLRTFNIDTKSTLEQNAAYIEGWIEKLSNDYSLLPIAASKAERAVEYILNEKQ